MKHHLSSTGGRREAFPGETDLLLAAATLLAASIHTFGVVEVPTAPQTSLVVAHPAPARAGDREPDRSVSDAVRLAERSHGPALLDALTTFDAAQLRAVDASATVQATVYDAPPQAAAVADWWSGLDPAARRRIEANAPAITGNLEGVPYAVRDDANRAFLADALRVSERSAITSSRTLAMLEQVQRSLRQAPGTPPKQLLTLDPRGAGRAAIAIGDMSSASDITVMVPGMFFTVTGQMQDWTNTAENVYAEQASLAPRATDERGGIAVLAWMGYRTPDLSNVLSLGLAKVGAQRFERVVTGIDTLRAASRPRINVVAHSYGSTTALIALSSGRIHVASLTLYGSPGSAVQNVRELGVTPGQVFVGDAHWDPVAGSGYFGVDPGSSAFGSVTLDLVGGADAAFAGDPFRSPFGHNDYLKPGTASLHDVALIAVGRSDLVQRSNNPNGPAGRSDPHSPQFLLVRPQDLLLRD